MWLDTLPARMAKSFPMEAGKGVRNLGVFPAAITAVPAI